MWSTGIAPKNDSPARPYPRALAYSLGLDPAETGVAVTDPGHGGAEQSGFELGDIILKINGDAVPSREALMTALSHVDRWRIVVRRGAETRQQDFNL